MTRRLLGAVFFFLMLSVASSVYAIEITNVKVASTTDQTATVTWTTDVKGDAMIHYGLDENAGLARDPTFTLTSHSLRRNLKS
jgi:phosphatidate phosphatase APP1